MVGVGVGGEKGWEVGREVVRVEEEGEEVEVVEDGVG